MTFQYLSDLHLEFQSNNDFMKRNPVKPVAEILLMAGDIVLFKSLGKHNDFFNYLSDHFKAVYWIPGNHEYYHYHDAATKCGVLNEKIKDNVFLVNNVAIPTGNVMLIFSTLWSVIRPAYQWQIERGVSDFRVIKFDGYRFSCDRFNELHKKSREFLEATLQQTESREKSVVVTHHVPTFLNYPEKYKGDMLNDAFAVELFDLIETNGPAFWIYGDHHCNIPEFKIGNTSMLTNQLGYVHQGEHLRFRGDVVLEV